MRNTGYLLTICALLVVVATQAIVLWLPEPARAPEPAKAAQDPAGAATPATPATIKAALAPFGPVAGLEFKPEPGLYQAKVGRGIVYVTADGHFAVAGDLYDLVQKTNITEQARAHTRQVVLEGLDQDQAITFSPAGEPKAVVWVFTDVECAYCRRFHQQIDAYLARGIEVRYLAFPRAGPDSEDWRLMEAVWCAKDPHVAITRAKNDAKVHPQPNCTAPVRTQYEAGLAVGLRGTPMIVTPTGEVAGGYLPPDALATFLGLGSG